MLFSFPRGVLDEILNLIESVSEGFPSYFCIPYVTPKKQVAYNSYCRSAITDIHYFPWPLNEYFVLEFVSLPGTSDAYYLRKYLITPSLTLFMSV